MKTKIPPLILSLFLLPLLLAQKPGPAPFPKRLRETVHHLFIQGHPLGEIMRRDEKLANGKYRHTYVLDMKLQRGPHLLEISSELQSLSNANLELEQFQLKKKEGSILITSSGLVEDGFLTLQTTRAGNTTSQKIPLPKDTMSSLSYDLHVWQNRANIATFEATIFHEDLGTFAQQTSKITQEPNGYKMVHHALNMETHEVYDLKGRLRSAHTLQMDLWALTPGQQPPDADKAPLDIMSISSWKTKRLPEHLETVTYKITIPNEVPFVPYTDAFQTIKAKKENEVEIEVRRFSPNAHRLTEKEKQKLRQSTALEPFDHPAIQALAKRLRKDKARDTEVIEAVTHFVYEHITNKSLDRGAASALETLEAQRGDCTEHSILMSAILRAQGFPTRLVDGLIVNDKQMGYHEWIEVYVEGQGFIPVDPTFNEMPAGPNRLKFAVGDSTPEGMVQLGLTATQLLSGIKVKVKSYTKNKNGKEKSGFKLP